MTVDVNGKSIQDKIRKLIDAKTMLQVHNLYAKTIDPWTPMAEGIMSHANLEITTDHIRYNTPYAHYVYMGELYLAANGSSWAKAGEKKFPSGRPLNYSKEMHPLATSKWDKAAMQVKRDVFLADVKKILSDRAKELEDGN